MIDPKCPIWLAGQGFCWTPSAAWGCTDEELCGKCLAKVRTKLIPCVVVGLVAVPLWVCKGCGLPKKRNRTICQACAYKRRRSLRPVA